MHLVDTTMFWNTSPGGVARYLLSKRRWLERHSNWKHTIVVPGPSGGSDRIRAPRIPFSGGYRFPLRRNDAARTLAKLQPDVIEAGDPYRLAWAALDTAERLRIPVAAFCHSDVEGMAADAGGRPARAATRRYLRNLYRHFDAVFVASRWMQNRVKDLGLDNVVYQPLGVDLSTFAPSRRDARWRRQLGFTEASFVLIYAGRLAPEKNLEILTRAVDRLGPPFELVVMGDGPARPSGRRVRLLPSATDPIAVATAVASADAFVHAGESETFGLAPLEALACGTPLVARASAGLAELLNPESGISVVRNELASWCEALSSLRERDLACMRRAARQSAQPFSESVVYARLYARYLALSARSAASTEMESAYA